MSTDTTPVTKYYRVLPDNSELWHHVKDIFDDKQDAMARAEELSFENDCTVELLEILGACEYSLTVAGKVVAALVEAGHVELASEFVESLSEDAQ